MALINPSETDMPLLTLDIASPPLTAAQRAQIQQGLTRLMASLLDKVAELTVVQLREQPDRSTWSVGGQPLSGNDWCARLQVAITAGSNSLSQQSSFLAAAHDVLQATMGRPPAAPLYIMMQNLPGAHWGYGGRSQASRRTPLPSASLPSTIRQLSGVSERDAPPAQGCALVLIDFQREYETSGRLPLTGLGAAAHEAERLVQAADACRVPVFHVHHVATAAHAPLFDHEGPGIQPMQQPTMGADHMVLTKHWPSALHETDLLPALRQRGVHTVVLAGCMTHNCVDSTARHAVHLGLQVVIAANACATRPLLADDGTVIAAEVVQQGILAGLADRHARVTSASEIAAAWRQAAAGNVIMTPH